MSRRDNQSQLLHHELLTGTFILIGVFGLGTFWYRYIEGWSWSEAAYMTMITLATVGFSEVQPLDESGRLFTMALILLGIISIGYIVNRFTEAMIQGYFQEGIRKRQKQRLIESLENHYIVCGYGRTGHQVAIEFEAEDLPFIIVDNSPEAIAEAEQNGYITALGDATLDEFLQSVGIHKAVCLVAALPSDAENLYTILSAKNLNPQIRAIARANNEEAILKLKRAGADAVVSPYITGGRRLAAAAVRPRVMDFVDGIITGVNRSLFLDEFLLDPKSCKCVGKTLSKANLRAQSGALVLAIRREDGTLIGGPMGDTLLMAGDLLICMGTAEQLRTLSRVIGEIRPL